LGTILPKIGNLGKVFLATIEKRKRQSGHVYRVKVRLRGHLPAAATFERIADAKRWAAETESAIRAGRWFRDAEGKKTTLAELLTRYEKEYLSTAPIRTKDSRVIRLRFWRNELGHLALTDVTIARVVEARGKLLRSKGRKGNTLAPATVNQYVGDLRHCFSIAKREFALVAENPLRDIKKLREPRGRCRFLSDAERDSLLTECKSHSQTLYVIVVVALSTGARKGEILGLRWPDVDMRRGMMTFHQTKNGERRTVPLVGLAHRLLIKFSKVRRIDTDLFFPGANGNPLVVDKMFRQACARARIDEFRFHDLRHTAASALAMNNATLAEIAEVLGHKTLQMVKRYAHLTEGHTRAVVARMNKAMFGG